MYFFALVSAFVVTASGPFGLGILVKWRAWKKSVALAFSHVAVTDLVLSQDVCNVHVQAVAENA